MKKSISTDRSVQEAPRRFTGWGVLAASLSLATVIFLVIGPLVERHAYLEAFDDLEDQERLKRGLLMLCNTESNLKHLNAQLAQKELGERNRITPVAQGLGCIDKLRPPLRAEYYLWNGEGEGIAPIVAQGEASVEPAIEALESDEERVRHRAARSLVALASELNDDQVKRIARRLSDEDQSKPIRALRVALDLPVPPVTTPPSAPPPALETHPTSVVHDMGHAPLDAGAARGTDAARDLVPLPVEPLKLREPTLDVEALGRPKSKADVLFRAAPPAQEDPDEVQTDESDDEEEVTTEAATEASRPASIEATEVISEAAGEQGQKAPQAEVPPAVTREAAAEKPPVEAPKPTPVAPSSEAVVAPAAGEKSAPGLMQREAP